MVNKLMYIGVTYETATVEERACVSLDKAQKDELKETLRTHLSIKAFAIITTCNRTEIYFESAVVTPHDIQELLITHVENRHQIKLSKNVFTTFDQSIDTVNHLLHVANGLRSAVIGDKQIIHQVKASYLDALNHGNQGSLLERAFQAVFRSHKRVSSESLYRQGSTSTAYSSLKMTEKYVGKVAIKHQKVLIIGAGEIAEDVLKYLPKFPVSEVFIANRTQEKAQKLANRFEAQTYEWRHIEENDFAPFDVIISAVSNRKNLVYRRANDDKYRLWIDLAMPSNIDPNIEDRHNKVYNIDEVTAQVHSVSETQLKAIPIVEGILKEELAVFTEWLNKSNVRSFLSAYKAYAKQVLLKSIPETSQVTPANKKWEVYAEDVANKLVRSTARALA